MSAPRSSVANKRKGGTLEPWQSQTKQIFFILWTHNKLIYDYYAKTANTEISGFSPQKEALLIRVAALNVWGRRCASVSNWGESWVMTCTDQHSGSASDWSMWGCGTCGTDCQSEYWTSLWWSSSACSSRQSTWPGWLETLGLHEPKDWIQV